MEQPQIARIPEKALHFTFFSALLEPDQLWVWVPPLPLSNVTGRGGEGVEMP